MTADHTWVASLALLTVTILSPGAGKAQADGDPVTIGTYRVIESAVLGETRRLLIHLPRGYEGSAVCYPVVYHTYGSFISSYYGEACAIIAGIGEDGRAPQMILVGIDNIDRYRDLLPIGRREGEGRSENYLRFLVTEVFPFVETNYRTAPHRILIGPQAGAVFCLDVLLTRPELFDAFILNNPFESSVNNDRLFELATRTVAQERLGPAFFHITWGGRNVPPGETDLVHRFADTVAPARARGFALHLNHEPENDDFIPPLGLKEGLTRHFAAYRPSVPAPFESLAEIDSHCARLTDLYGFTVPPAEMWMIQSGVRLMQEGRADAAAEIFQRATQLYPRMVNAWWQLAGLAAERGDVDEAARLYRHCQAIDPSLANFVQRRLSTLRRAGE